ncbi:hypothetical protein Rsub_09242 [Raphidocelis subcapitata]|uniref:Uncharacterized protein n=1 Tax=Raphidocelis subcapitata TaxID=307507 RepID=A0A2V0PEW4_9CHLO|nr:hypothetical protein Rsub_09242 [Raphidocelis subcapitata]|eukprot:GBF96443.1 hypothetical protein Rsub_09242 [Raphidocelis subcapitata]
MAPRRRAAARPGAAGPAAGPPPLRPRLLLLLALLAAPAARADGGEGFGPLASSGAQQRILSDKDFPAARPPLWTFRTLKDVRSAACTKSKQGVIKLQILHKKLKGVTAEQMVWFYENLDRAKAKHPVDGKTYPLFLMFHPRDHINHTASGHPYVSGKDISTTWIEFHLTNCTEQPGDALERWVCPQRPPARNPGVVKTTPRSVWMGLNQNNGTSLLKGVRRSSIYFAVKGCNEKGQCANVIRTFQNWVKAKVKKGTTQVPGLLLTTTFEVGLSMGLATAEINPRIVNNWRNGEDEMSKCWRQALHFVEEMGALELWLPGAYKAAQAAASGTAGADAAAADAAAADAAAADAAVADADAEAAVADATAVDAAATDAAAVDAAAADAAAADVAAADVTAAEAAVPEAEPSAAAPLDAAPLEGAPPPDAAAP